MKRLTRKQVDELLVKNEDLNSNARLVLLAYASSMTYDGKIQETWLKTEKIASFCGLSPTTVGDYRKHLIKDGFLYVNRTEQNGNKTKHFFHICEGKVESSYLKRRSGNKGSSNLTPGNPKKKPIGSTEEGLIGSTEEGLIGSTERGSIGSTEEGGIGGTDANNKLNTKSNTKMKNKGADAHKRDSYINKINRPSLTREERSEAEDQSDEPSSLPSGEAANDSTPRNSSNDDESSFAGESGDSPRPEEAPYRFDRKGQVRERRRCPKSGCGFRLSADGSCARCEGRI